MLDFDDRHINRNGRCDIIYFAVKVSNNSKQLSAINLNGGGQRGGRMCAMYDNNRPSAKNLQIPRKIDHVISSLSTFFYHFYLQKCSLCRSTLYPFVVYSRAYKPVVLNFKSGAIRH